MSAHSKGTGTFIQQRVTALIGIFMTIFLVWLVVRLAGADRAEMVDVFGNPLVWIPMLVLLAVTVIHMRIGMLEVIHDYVASERLVALAMTLNTVFSLAIGIVGAIAVLILAFAN